jgi:hypothetical protein
MNKIKPMGNSFKLVVMGGKTSSRKMGLSFSPNKKFQETTSSDRNDLSLRRLNVSPKKVSWKTTS